MEIHRIKKYWTDAGEELYCYKPFQLNNQRLFKNTIEFLVDCGLPESCAPGLSFEDSNYAELPTPNQVFKIDFEELNNFLLIGYNGSGDPICIDLYLGNEIVYLNHDNFFERVFMNSSVQQLAECIIKYRDFHASLNPQIIDNRIYKRKFTDDEFKNICGQFIEIDNFCLADDSCWKAELYYLLWERDNE